MTRESLLAKLETIKLELTESVENLLDADVDGDLYSEVNYQLNQVGKIVSAMDLNHGI